MDKTGLINLLTPKANTKEILYEVEIQTLYSFLRNWQHREFEDLMIEVLHERTNLSIPKIRKKIREQREPLITKSVNYGSNILPLNVFQEYREDIYNSTSYGEIYSGNDRLVHLSEVTHCIRDVSFKKNVLSATIQILKGTPKGNAILEYMNNFGEEYFELVLRGTKIDNAIDKIITIDIKF